VPDCQLIRRYRRRHFILVKLIISANYADQFGGVAGIFGRLFHILCAGAGVAVLTDKFFVVLGNILAQTSSLDLGFQGR